MSSSGLEELEASYRDLREACSGQGALFAEQLRPLHERAREFPAAQAFLAGRLAELDGDLDGAKTQYARSLEKTPVSSELRSGAFNLWCKYNLARIAFDSGEIPLALQMGDDIWNDYVAGGIDERDVSWVLAAAVRTIRGLMILGECDLAREKRSVFCEGVRSRIGSDQYLEFSAELWNSSLTHEPVDPRECQQYLEFFEAADFVHTPSSREIAGALYYRASDLAIGHAYAHALAVTEILESCLRRNRCTRSVLYAQVMYLRGYVRQERGESNEASRLLTSAARALRSAPVTEADLPFVSHVLDSLIKGGMHLEAFRVGLWICLRQDFSNSDWVREIERRVDKATRKYLYPVARKLRKTRLVRVLLVTGWALLVRRVFSPRR